MIVLEGEIEFEVEGDVHQPQPGDELFISGRSSLGVEHRQYDGSA